MVSIWVTNSDLIIANGVVNLSDGRTVSLADIPGKSFNTARLGKIATKIQTLIDKRLLIADMQVDDPDKAPALAGDDAYFQSIYGGRRFIDGDSLVDRTTLISLELVDGVVLPTVSVVR